MTTYSNNFRIPHLDQNVAQPEIPENTAKNIIDNILSNVYTYNITSTDVSNGYVNITHTDDPTQPTDWQSFMIKITDTGVLLTGQIDIKFPDNARPYIFVNNTSKSLNFKTTSGTGFVIASGNNAYAFSDGTNISKLEFAASGSGTTIEGMSDTPSGYGSANDVLISNGSSFFYYSLDNKLNKTGGTISNYGEVSQTVSSSSNALDIDLVDGNVVEFTATENVTITFTTTHTNTSFTLLATNLGSYTITWPTILWEGGTEPVWSASGDDLITLTKIGTKWVGGALIGVS